jgi:hypothetical protein
MDHIGDRQIVEPGPAQAIDVLEPEHARRRRERHRGGDDGVPALSEIGADAGVEQPVDVTLALRIGRRVACVYGGAIQAPVDARGRRGGQLALAPRQARVRVVEDVLVGARPGLQRVGVASEEPEVRRLDARGVHQALQVALGHGLDGERLEPGQPVELSPGEDGRGRVLLRHRDGIAHVDTSRLRIGPGPAAR